MGAMVAQQQQGPSQLLEGRIAVCLKLTGPPIVGTPLFTKNFVGDAARQFQGPQSHRGLFVASVLLELVFQSIVESSATQGFRVSTRPCAASPRPHCSCQTCWRLDHAKPRTATASIVL